MPSITTGIFIFHYRCDQYRWVHLGVYDISYGDKVLKKRSNVVDGKFCHPKKGNKSFHRWEYWGYS